MRNAQKLTITVNVYAGCAIIKQKTKNTSLSKIPKFNRTIVKRDQINVANTPIHGSTISLRCEVWAHQTSLTPSLFIEVPVTS